MTQPSKSKPRRDIRSFEAQPDVGRMLNRATKGGIKASFLCNAALRDYLAQKGYDRKKDAVTTP